MGGRIGEEERADDGRSKNTRTGSDKLDSILFPPSFERANFELEDADEGAREG